ncbi:polysaccharide pyruvyl transferase family protein [Phocaeicola sartorii]
MSLLDALQYKNVCLMGYGWGNYNKFYTDPYTKWVYRRLFNNGMQHAVRDEYTQRKLTELGITNVIYTACPTMWNLTPEHCKKIPTAKAQSVMTTLTAYHADKDRDKQMMNILVSSYNQIFFWPQQIEDIDYLRLLDFDKSKLTILSPSLKEYDKILASENIDYVGTRLHGGIRALNFGRRTLIISIDNRATEINKTSNIPILNRTDIDYLKGIIDTNFSTNVFLPHENITKWKQQFHK